MGAVVGFIFITRPDDVIGVLDEFACLSFLAALKIGVAQEVDGMGLVMKFRLVHFRGMSSGSRRGNIRSDGILPETEAHEDVGRHVQGVRRVRCDGRVAAGGFEALRCEFGTIGGGYPIMSHAWMIGMLLEERIKNGNSFLEICR